MHTPYEIKRPAEVLAPGEGRTSHLLAKVATLTYWVPMLSVDVLVVSRAGLRPEGFVLAGNFLFRETIVYLGFWLLVAGIQAFMFSRSAPRSRRKSGAAKQDSARIGNAALNRERTGL